MVLKVLSVVVVVALCVGDVFGVSDGILSSTEKEYIVKSHNVERRKKGGPNMYKLVWDDDLEKEAQKLADKCQSSHTPDGVRKWGENMAMMMFPKAAYLDGFPTTNKIDIVVTKGMGPFKSWIQEQDYVNPSYDGEEKKLDFSCIAQSTHTCGHFSQVVWHKSTKIGCAAKNCLKFTKSADKSINNVWLLVCDYMVPGNMAGEQPFEPGEACSKCEAGDSCEDGLCVAP